MAMVDLASEYSAGILREAANACSSAVETDEECQSPSAKRERGSSLRSEPMVGRQRRPEYELQKASASVGDILTLSLMKS